jgi:hypothetical protein
VQLGMDFNQSGQQAGQWVPQPPGNASGSYPQQQLGMPPMPPIPPQPSQYGGGMLGAPPSSMTMASGAAHPWVGMPLPPQPPARPGAITAVGPSAVMPPGLIGAQGGLPAVSMSAASPYGMVGIPPGVDAGAAAGAQWWQAGGAQQAQGYGGYQLPPLQGMGDPGAGPPPAVAYMLPMAPPPPAAGKKTKKGDGAAGAASKAKPKAKTKAGAGGGGEAVMGGVPGAPGELQLPPLGFPIPTPAEGKKSRKGAVAAMTRDQAAAAATARMQQLSDTLPRTLQEGRLQGPTKLLCHSGAGLSGLQ